MASPYWDRRHNPSFSSSLLDSIYNSIEEEEEEDSGMKRSNKEDMGSFMIDKWMEKKGVATKSMPDDLPNSSSTSSNSSSSDSDSSTLPSTLKSSSTSSSCYSNRTKPIRTGKPAYEQPKKHRQGGFVKTKSRALKMYSDLKQPISPGGRISNFLNSIFSAKKPNSDHNYSSKSGNTSSRSCLSKTPSSNKRSVRFYPVSVIVDQDCRPCGHKNLHREDPSFIDDQLKLHRVLEEKRRVREAAMDLLNNYRQNQIQIQYQVDDQEDYDDASCASSDLFELDNLSSIGVDVDQRYIQELPVYETTHLPTNQRIANGFIP